MTGLSSLMSKILSILVTLLPAGDIETAIKRITNRYRKEANHAEIFFWALWVALFKVV